MTNVEISDCWNKIGVWRQDHDVCPLLSKVVHCRNCETYINAGLALLDRELPESYTDDTTKTFNIAAQDKNIEQVSCLIFRLGHEWHAIKTVILNEICEISDIHSIPHNKNSILEGLVNIHGEMEICISLAQLIIKQKPDNNDNKTRSRLVVIKLNSGKYAFKACEVMGIYPINTTTLLSPPSTITNANQQLTESIFEFNNQSIGLIDISYLDTALIGAIT